ncbi:MAG: hypothetical protein JSV05_01855 [Candidatus Bathyarchaeota archaeon]|nr:MAG: hypothetical protein JSV05_01855 [Candidatus Bathyarchaeota archaeon]
MGQSPKYLEIRIIFGFVTLIVGLLAANLALFHWVEQTGLHYLLGDYARYVCAYGGFMAMIFGATLVSNLPNPIKILKKKRHQISSEDKKIEKTVTVEVRRKDRKQTITALSLAILIFMLFPLVASSLVSYTATIIMIFKSATSVYYRSNTGSNLLFSPKERTWNGSTWSSETEMPSSGAAIQWVRAAHCPSSSRGYEKIIVTLSDNGYLDAYVWNGSAWLVTNDIGYVGTIVNFYRAYDVVYEISSGNAMLVYGISSVNTSRDLAYKTWNGAQWSTEAYINDPSMGDIQYYWIKLAPYPLRVGRVNEVALIASEEPSNDANAWIWNGSSWGNYLQLEGSIASRTTESISVEYEQQSGEAMFIWGWRGGGGIGYLQSRKWTGTWGSELPQMRIGRRPRWFALKADPSSNRMMTLSVDQGRDLYTVRWNGSGWTRDSRHDANVDSSSTRCADFEWEPNESNGLLVWGSSTDSLSYKTLTAFSTWSGLLTVPATGTHPWVQLRRNTGVAGVKILGSMLNSNYNLGALKWNGETLTNIGDSTFTSDTTTTAFECFDICFSNPR